jgi:hypothetical protein
MTPSLTNGISDWIDFKSRVLSLHPLFFETLARRHPDLKAQEVKMCAAILMECNTTDCAQTLGITTRASQIMQQRLRAKFGLSGKENLHAYLQLINNQEPPASLFGAD